MHRSAELHEKHIPEGLCNMHASRQSIQAMTGTLTCRGFGMAMTAQAMSSKTNGTALVTTVQPWEHLTW